MSSVDSRRPLFMYCCVSLVIAAAQSANNVQLVQSQNITAESTSETPRPLKLEYCREKPKFHIGRGSFLAYMMRLSLCSVSEGNGWLEQECRQRTYAFTDYYSVAYTKFCDERLFNRSCQATADTNGKISPSSNPNSIVRWWLQKYNITATPTITQTTSSSPTPHTPAASDACFQISNYFSSLLGWYEYTKNETTPLSNSTADFNNPFMNPDYSEWFLAYRPFCEPVACGSSRRQHDKSALSSYDCFQEPCRSGIIFVIVLDSVLAVLIIIANVLVLVVAARTQIMRNIPGYFKISLAAADLMIGLFVLPGSVYQNYVLYIGPLPYRVEGQRPHATDYFDQRYLNFMGVFTVLSMGISIYTMGAASVDRYLAITRPFRYRQGKYLTKKRVAGVFGFIWLFALVCAIYPTFLSSQYDISALSLVLATGNAASAIYAITLGIPLFAVWIINGMMLKQVCADGKSRRTMSASRITVNTRLSSGTSNCDPTKNGPKDCEATQIQNNNVFKSPNEPSEKPKALPKPRFSRITRSVQRTLKFARHPSLASGNNQNPQSQANVERKLAKTLAVMIGAFTLAILPSIIVLVLMSALSTWTSPRTRPKTYSPVAMNALVSAQYIAARLFLSNSFWNCIIYSVRNRHFRRALADSFICDEAKKRERRRGASIASNRERRLRKMGSTDSGCVSQSNSEGGKRRISTQVWEMSCVSRKYSDQAEDATSGGVSRV